MGDINTFALQEAEAAGARLWALGRAPFPLVGGAILQGAIEQEVTDTAIAFAIHLRRVLDNKADGAKFQLDEPFRLWTPAKGLTKVADLRDALNRIVHATEFQVGFERLPESAATIIGGAIGVIYLKAKTDRKDEALIDVFALAACFFHKVLPTVSNPSSESNVSM
jgi:hypothetical protein